MTPAELRAQGWVLASEPGRGLASCWMNGDRFEYAICSDGSVWIRNTRSEIEALIERSREP